MSEFLHRAEIDASPDPVWALTFTAHGECLVSAGYKDVRVWRFKDGEQVARMRVKDEVWSIAVSKDGKYIAAGSTSGVLVWDATTYERVFVGKIDAISPIRAIDFSPDSTHLVSAIGSKYTAIVWDIAARRKVQTLHHDWVQAAKYSPQGDQIATAGDFSIRVWDSDHGHLLVDVEVGLRLKHGLLWFNNHLFVKTNDGKVRQLDASTGSTVSEWSVPSAGYTSCIALPQHGRFLAYSTEDNITLWDTSTHRQLGLIPCSNEGRSISFSPDDRLLAIAGRERKIVIKTLFLVRDIDIRIENVALNAWRRGQLTRAQGLLSTAVPMSEDSVHLLLASRALVRAQLRRWDAALVDAEESIKLQASAVGYIAKFVVLIGKGDTQAGCRVCDTAFLLFPNLIYLLLLVKAVVLFMAGEHDDAISRIDHLISIVDVNSALYVVQACMHLQLGKLHMVRGDYNCAIQSYESAQVKIGDRTDQPPLIVSLISGWKFDNLAIIIQQRLCEALFVVGRIEEAGKYVLHIMDRETNMPESIKMWTSELTQQCLSTHQNNRDASSVTDGHSDVSTSMIPLLKGWARHELRTVSWKNALTVATGFIFPRFTIYQVICDHLETTSRVMDAVACFHKMCDELVQEIDGEQVNWTRDFKSRCCGKLEGLGDSSMDAMRYDDAISQYATALSLNPVTPQDLLGKRSRAHAGKGEWEDALNDANEVVKLDPSSPWGYERKHAALHGIGYYEDAIRAMEIMLLKISESSDSEIRERSVTYARPENTKEVIRAAIKSTIRDSPPVLIDTLSGRLCNKLEQTSTFETTPTFMELVSSMITCVDDARIEQQVGEYFQYATFSHKWGDNEPLFEKVIKVVVYDLELSPAHEKLQMFCKIVREAGFKWAWSDTCCINKGDHFVLQEALVSMFRWYERSAMTIIFLCEVGRLAKRGALTKSIWNMRAWTLQEYHASKVVRFYTKDWTPYLDLDIYNHKHSPEIISEMEEATGISAQALIALRPGLDNIREKLCLASTRQTARVEDAAYSLLGIFSLSMPITYGEGDQALGRLLSLLLASSGDASILAWTGKSGSFNSCLPSNISVFIQPPSTHIPATVSDAEMSSITAGLRSLDLALLTKLHAQLNGLFLPSFSGCRMRVPCIIFKLGQLSVPRNTSERAFRAQTNALGVVEIRTEEDLSQLGSLFLVHPWIDCLLDRQPVGNVTETIVQEDVDDEPGPMLGEPLSFADPSDFPSTPQEKRHARLFDALGLSFGGQSNEHTPDTLFSPLATLADTQSVTSTMDNASLLPPSSITPSEKELHVLQFIARLRQPFGALLLTPTRRNVDEYRRVASESLITVQVEELTPAVLEKLIQGVRMVDIL